MTTTTPDPALTMLTGRFAAIYEPTTRPHLAAARRIVNAGENPLRWRLGHRYSMKEMADELDSCYAKFLVQSKHGRNVGLIEVLRLEHDVAHVAFALHPSMQRKLWPWEGMAITLDWLFGFTPLSPPDDVEVVMFETTEFNREQFAKNSHGLFTLVARGTSAGEEVPVPGPLGGGTCPMNEYAFSRGMWASSTMRQRWCRRQSAARSESEHE